VRRGGVPLGEVLDEVASLEHRVTELRSGSDVPPEPDRSWVDDRLHRSYLATWAASEEGARSPG
jgi:hypothetical protein